MSILDETRRVVEDSPLLPPFSFIPSAVSSFSVTPCTSSRWLPFVPARCNEGTKTSRRLRRSGDRETEALPALAHRTLWYRHRGLPFTLHLFYFIFRGINVFGALPVGQENAFIMSSCADLSSSRSASPRAFSFFHRPRTRNRGIK